MITGKRTEGSWTKHWFFFWSSVSDFILEELSTNSPNPYNKNAESQATKGPIIQISK